MPGEQNEYVEPAHEALIRAWDKVVEWRKEEAEKLPLQRAVTQATSAYSRGQGGLWTNDKRLGRVEQLAGEDPYWLNTQERRFIRESVHRRRRNGQTLWSSVSVVIVALSILTIWALFS